MRGVSSPPLGPFLDWWESLAVWACLPADHGPASCTFGLSAGNNHFFHVNKAVRWTKTHQEEPGAVDDSSCGTEGFVRIHQHQSSAASSQQVHLVSPEYSQMERQWFGTIRNRQAPAAHGPPSSSANSVWDSCENMEQGPTAKVSSQRAGPSAPRDVVLEKSLPLFGRGDHSQDEDELLTAQEKISLTARAIKLFVIFMPIVLLGGIALLLAHAIDSQKDPKGAQKREDRGEGGVLSSRSGANGAPVKHDGTASWLRSFAFHRLLEGCRLGS